MGVGEDFSTFRDRYVLNPELIGSISYRYKRITRQLNSDFRNNDSETANSWYVGSYGRDTAAKGLSDLDVGYVLPSSVHQKYSAYLGNGQSALLQAVRQSIANTYPSTSVSGDGQVVVVTFADGIRFEILPAFTNSDNSWTYPNSNKGGSWLICNPWAEIAAIKERSGRTNRNLKHLCRMMRVWRDNHGVPISGILIDTLAYSFIDTWGYADKSFLYHDYMVRDFFKHLYDQSSNQTYWRAPGSQSYVWRSGPFEYHAGQAYRLALDAIQYNDDRYEWSRRQKWREISALYIRADAMAHLTATYLEDQIRECFGRVVYTHKTHEKQADRCSAFLNRLKILQIALTAMTASGAVSAFVANEFWLKALTAVLALLALLVSGYMKGFDPGSEAQRHRSAAATIWPIRESYLSLLTDLRAGAISREVAIERRDDLQAKLAAIYENAPQTGDHAYRNAQDALKIKEDLTFSDDEIDKFLPRSKKR